MNYRKTIPILLFISSALWLFAFKDFLSGKLRLIVDAVSYYDHIKFYIDNIGHGVYPLWDHFWQTGLPNEFFLRRIGAFNPFYFFIMILHKAGLPYVSSYLIFLSAYFFLGMSGFYLLAKRIFQDTTMALAAFLLLLFSSLGTLLFFNYIIFLFTPIAWFFYFLLSFSQEPKKLYGLGITFTLMIILTTYIPFYFLTILLISLLCFILLYFRCLKTICLRYYQFLQKHKIFVSFCTFCLILSLLPGLFFYLEGQQNDIVLPMRHANSSSENTLSVDLAVIEGGEQGIITRLQFDKLFPDFRKTGLELFHIPIFGYLLLLLGAFTALHKRNFFFLLCGVSLFLILSTEGPIYHFLYQHVFFFKYFRNSTNFLWIFLLPVFILFIVDQLRAFLNIQTNTITTKYGLFLYLILVHLAAFIFLHKLNNAIITSYAVIGFSFLFFVYHFFLASKLHQKAARYVPLFLFILTATQSMEVFHYINQNAFISKDSNRYDAPHENFTFTRWGESQKQDLTNTSEENTALIQKPSILYITTKWHNLLHNNINPNILDAYARHKFILYDDVQWINNDITDLNHLQRLLKEKKNLALISSPDFNKKTITPIAEKNHPKTYQLITENSQQFQVLKFNPNAIKVKTHFDTQKFLVYNDNFHKDWKAFLNGKETPLWQANIAFKGVWLPAGENTVTFRYGTWWHYSLNYFLLGLFNFILFYLISLWMKQKQIEPATDPC